MLQAALRLIGIDLHQQASRLADRVQEAKQEFYREIREAITDLKAEAVGTGINVGLVIVAAQFAFLALIAGLVAIFFWIAPEHGPVPALLGIALACLLMGCVLFGIAKTRSSRPSTVPVPERHRPLAAAAEALTAEDLPRSPIPPEPPRRPVETPSGHVRVLAPLLVQAASRRGSLSPDMQERLAKHGAAAAEDIADKVEDVFRHGSRSAIFGTILVTMLAGAAVGWRWRR